MVESRHAAIDGLVLEPSPVSTVHYDYDGQWLIDPGLVAILLVIALSVWTVRNWLNSRHLR